MIKRSAVTTNFLLIVAVVSVLGSALIGSQIPNFLSHPHATAASLPQGIDWHYKLKERVGDAEAGSRNIKITEGYIDAEIHCEPCTKVEYTPGPRGKAGIAYVLDSVLDFSGAKSVSFFMMGVEGDEKVKLKVAGKEDKAVDIKNRVNERLKEAREKVADKVREKLPSLELFTEQRFALTSEEVTLEDDWKKYTIDLTGTDLTAITHPFALEILKKKGNEKVTLFFKHIIYETESAGINSLATTETALAGTLPLTLQIIPNSTSGIVPAAIEFSANATGGVPPYLFNWTFGDGGQAEGELVSHTFETSGSYNVTLTAADSLGQTASSSVVVQIEEAANPITVGIEANSTEGSAPTLIEFEADVAGGTGPYQFEWNFGDGIEEDDETVSHMFENAGQYNVTVNVTDSEDQTGSSSIAVNITEIVEEEIDEEPALNDTGNETTTTPQVPDEGEGALPPEETELPEVENTPPVARVVGDLLAYPGDDVVLDASQSFDQEDEDDIQYVWVQSDGPTAEMTGADTASPTIEIPSDLDQDEEIVMDLTVIDKNDTESEQESVTIFVDYIESLDSDDALEEQELEPDESEDSEWATECDDLIDCLTDGEQDTFVSAGSSDEDEENMDLFSFEDFGIEENQEAQIRYVSIQLDATKSHDTGYIRFLLGNDEFVSDLVSIMPDTEEHRIILEEDPRTGDEWTVESVNSLIAGYSYAGGQSEIRISEIAAIVAYTVTAIVDSQEDVGAETTTEDVLETEEQIDSSEEANNNQTSDNAPVPE